MSDEKEKEYDAMIHVTHELIKAVSDDSIAKKYKISTHEEHIQMYKELLNKTMNNIEESKEDTK